MLGKKSEEQPQKIKKRQSVTDKRPKKRKKANTVNQSTVTDTLNKAANKQKKRQRITNKKSTGKNKTKSSKK